ncbi:DUF72 domain-containing protein [Shewanella sp. YIC-542]|uniref:DUF72 domain-containing protein n=1 Tax=Shewanella mytili TaxID=3377111 RepID=UPI00398EED9E
MSATPLRLGMAMWSHAHWQQVYGEHCAPAQRLARYAQVFGSVEGNTSFYATPSPAIATAWAQAVPASFRFTFKLPQTITHQQQLRHCQQALTDFFNAMAPLTVNTGLWQIQLPAAFGPDALPLLARFLQQLPSGLAFGVEVRHPQFFAKGAAEQQLNRLLMSRGINRIIMDSRPLFADQSADPLTLDAQQKKPRVPVHAIATGPHPMVRFIGQLDLAASERLFTPWLAKLSQWLAQDREPYLFVHTPDNAQAPQLAARLWQRLSAYQQSLQQPPLPPLNWPDTGTNAPQLTLFE